MKIGLAILNAEPERGGAERYTVELGASLVGRGHEVYLLASRFARDVEPAKQVRLAGAAGSRTGRYRAYIDSLDEHLKTAKYDIVHAMLPVHRCDLYHPHAGIEVFNLAMGHLRHAGAIRQAISHLSNQLNIKRRVYAAVETELLEQNGAAVLCLSRAMQQIAEEHHRLREGQAYVLVNGVDLERYDPARREGTIRGETRAAYGIGTGDVAALLMANNYRLKGLRQAMQVLAGLKAAGQERAKLLVVGREPVEPYRRLAASLGVADRVVFAGATADPCAFYAACDLFVLPTAYDSCSLVVLEALAMGKPVITTRRNGACEAMSDGKQGFVIEDQADVEGFREAWESLLNDGLRGQMAEAALRLRGQLSKERHVDRLVEIYETIRAGRG